MFYSIEKEDGKIVSKRKDSIVIELPSSYITISKDLYDSIGVIPCSFSELDGVIKSIEYIEPVPLIIEPLKPTYEDYLLDLDFRLSKIELGI